MDLRQKASDASLVCGGAAKSIRSLKKGGDALQREIMEIELELIDSFAAHPYRVQNDEDMRLLADSIAERGILVPVIVRKKDGGRFELISGHRRCFAAGMLGLTKVPAEIWELDEDEAILLMVESNCQRSHLLYSEKAFAYKMRLEALKRQGRYKENALARPLVANANTSAGQVGEDAGISARQVQRFIRLTELIPELLTMVDEGHIAFRTAVELSYLSKQQQTDLYEAVVYYEGTPSLSQAIKMKSLSRSGELDADTIAELMEEEKPNQRERISVRADLARKYIPESVVPSAESAYLLQALRFYYEAHKPGGEAR